MSNESATIRSNHEDSANAVYGGWKEWENEPLWMWVLPPDIPKNNKERWSMITRSHYKSDTSNLLPAQKKALRLIIVATNVVFVREQRRDTYYRNDPKKYGLEKNG